MNDFGGACVVKEGNVLVSTCQEGGQLQLSANYVWREERETIKSC